MDMFKIFTAMKTQEDNSSSSDDSETESDFIINSVSKIKIPIVISILHNEVSSIYRAAGIGEKSINPKTVERVKQIIYKTENRDIDLLINTSGGCLASTKQICETLLIYKKKYPDNKIRAYIQYRALSGGTLIALCADELYMSDYCHMGLVDPQICGLSLTDITSVIDIKNEKAWDFYYTLKNMSDRSVKLCTQILTKVLESNSKYLNSKENIIKFLLNDELPHGGGFTIEECMSIGITRNGDIPDKINKLFDSEHLAANPVKKDYMSSITSSFM